MIIITATKSLTNHPIIDQSNHAITHYKSLRNLMVEYSFTSKINGVYDRTIIYPENTYNQNSCTTN